jgi:outer membrane protein assembly factor BamB
MGEHRDGVYRETGLIESIPSEGLNVKWRMPIGGGYAGPAVASGRVFLFDYVLKSGDIVNNPGQRARLDGAERLIAFDAQSGKELWSYKYDCPYNISYPAGPRCTPTVDGEHVFILGSEGDLSCLQVADGQRVWSINFKQQFQAKVPIWGFATHPLVVGDLLYTMVGGEGQGIVAINKKNGEVVWKALDCNAGYCPPTLIEFGGRRQLIVYHPEGVSSLNPDDGSEYWSIPIKPQYEMSIARPMIDGNKMYASGIGNQSVMIELDSSKPAAREVWKGTPANSIFSANATPLFVDGVLYGSDCHSGKFMAVDSKDGSRLWTTFEATRPGERRRVNHGTGFVTRIGETDRYFIMNEAGDLLMARLTAEAFQSLGRFHLLEPVGEAFGRKVVWSHPAYAEKTVFARNDKEIVAVDLTGK